MKMLSVRCITLRGILFMLPAMLLVALTGCIFSDYDETGLTLKLSFPEEYMPRQHGMNINAEVTRASASEPLVRRCVVELFKPGTRTSVTRKEFTFQEASPERATVKLQIEGALSGGKYDIGIWSDYVVPGKESDSFYDTSLLSDVRIRHCDGKYTSDVAQKDAAYAFLPGVTIICDSKQLDVKLKRPLSRYVVIADDVEKYERYMRQRPKLYPQVDSLVFTLKYQFYFPIAFDVTTGSPTDAALDMSYSCHAKPWDNYDPKEKVVIADDFLLTGDKPSFFTFVLETYEASTGRFLSRISGVPVDFRQGFYTIIRGDFLSINFVTGVYINTSWEGDILYEI